MHDCENHKIYTCNNGAPSAASTSNHGASVTKCGVFLDIEVTQAANCHKLNSSYVFHLFYTLKEWFVLDISVYKV